MTKSKIIGALIIFLAIILIILTIAYATIFSAFGLKSGGSILMILPLILISFGLVILFSSFLYFGIKYLKK